MRSEASTRGIGAKIVTAIGVVICFTYSTRVEAGEFSRPVKPSLTFVMHPIGHGGSGEIRIYDGAPNGTEIDVSVLPWLDEGEMIIVKGTCAESSSKTIAHLKLEPIPMGVDVGGKDIGLPTPLQEMWDFYSTLTVDSFVDQGLSVVARDSKHRTQWCGDLAHSNEGDPLPADY